MVLGTRDGRECPGGPVERDAFAPQSLEDLVEWAGGRLAKRVAQSEPDLGIRGFDGGHRVRKAPLCAILSLVD